MNETSRNSTWYAIIVAGGSGRRFGSTVPKQFLDLDGKPILAHTLLAFEHALAAHAHELLVALPQEHIERWATLCREFGPLPSHAVVAGGATRWESVQHVLATLDEAVGEGDVIAVHDAVRPLASRALIVRAFETAARVGAVVPAVPVTDSLRQLDDAGGSVAVERARFRAVQTPQAFDAQSLIAAYKQPYRDTYTDDASVIEAAGHPITLIEGEVTNIKVTTPADLALARHLLRHGNA